jgi:FlaA1/EpsC-like NDP-sugar epimerase
VVIIGAGSGGVDLLESLNPQRYTISGFVDDHAVEVPGHHPYRVLGVIDHLPGIIDEHQPDEVLLAIPTLSGARRKDVVKACRDRSTLLSLPRLHDLGIGWTLKENRRRLMTQLRPVEVEETIGDERVELDDRATSWLQSKCAVVVGAGAFGTEICRRLADGDIGWLVVIDRRHSALAKLKEHLADTREFRSIDPRVGEATLRNYLTRVFGEYEPMAVFNATGRNSAQAFAPEWVKHDPGGWETTALNEAYVAHAIAHAAAEAAVEHTVHVSSRRAGWPQDLFGAMKALVEELVLQCASRSGRGVQTVVRIGPLLDSRNGRLARMKNQIRTAARVTIPGPDAEAHFVSTARWAELVLHAARLGSNAEVLEPDVGHRIRVKEVAEDAIRLRGWYPGDDVVIHEGGSDSWDDRPAPPPRRAKDASLRIFSVERPTASEATLADAWVALRTAMREYRVPRLEWLEQFEDDIRSWQGTKA